MHHNSIFNNAVNAVCVCKIENIDGKTTVSKWAHSSYGNGWFGDCSSMCLEGCMNMDSTDYSENN